MQDVESVTLQRESEVSAEVAGRAVSKPPVRPKTGLVAPLPWLTPIHCTTTKSSGQDRAHSVITSWRRKSAERRVAVAVAAAAASAG